MTYVSENRGLIPPKYACFFFLGNIWENWMINDKPSKLGIPHVRMNPEFDVFGNIPHLPGILLPPTNSTESHQVNRHPQESFPGLYGKHVRCTP
jgi:hypothetical protein